MLQMNDMRARLAKCFGAVFPELSNAEILTASAASIGSWDSLGTVTLICVLEEEFQVAIGLEDAEQLMSFDLILNYLQHDKQLS
jgi:acyl carrier protein